jgi:hypothetical protein
MPRNRIEDDDDYEEDDDEDEGDGTDEDETEVANDDEDDLDEDKDEDDQPQFVENLVFVIMAFHGRDSDAVFAAIKAGCTRIYLKAKRVDENVGSGLIIKEITDLIDDAEFIVCDLTDERPNVYYELGYAHGAENESERILLIAKEGTKLHFDIAPLRVEFYKSTEDLRNMITNKLRAMRKVTRSPEWLEE